MAMDEALMLGLIEDPSAVHTLRFYWFDPPALSIGANQPLEEVDLAACDMSGIDVVRRPTGGRAVLHDGCITYSLCGPAEGPVFGSGIRAGYKRIAMALERAVHSLGAPNVVTASPDVKAAAGPSCFDSAAPYELLAGGQKLAGSAQVRRRDVAMQHGSLRLSSGRVPIAELLRNRSGRPDAVTRGDPPVLSAVVGRVISRAETVDALMRSFSEVFGVALEQGELTDAERREAARLEEHRYGDPAWTGRR